MCGIAGQIAIQKNHLPVSAAMASQALRDLGHRGPDSQGQFSDSSVWLGHVRLSILDLTSAGHQPMNSADERYVISYNGEVYNFIELAKELKLENLHSHSDTEVVLKAFEKIGPASFKMLNGMFAFAIYDKQKKKVWLVRDRLGIKPLYYQQTETSLSFSSEIKALMGLTSSSSSTCNLNSVHEWLYYGTTWGEPTLLQGVRKLLPGHYLELDLATSSFKIESYWSPTEYAGLSKSDDSLEERTSRTRTLLEKAVKRQLISDVPVGIFLSGGIDSSAITAFASRHYQGKLATYSVGFDFDKGVNELPKAKKVAELYGTDHHELHVSGQQISDIVEKMVDHHGMPFSDSANIPLYLLCSKLEGRSKVILQGDGGDELFGGYSRYTTLSFYKTAKAAAWIGSQLTALMPRNSQSFRRQRYFHAWAPKDPAHVMALLLTEQDGRESPTLVFSEKFRKQIQQSDPFSRFVETQKHFQDEDIVNQMLLVDSMLILPDIFLEKVDRSTMAASIEVRVPFLDNDLVDYCMRLSGPQKVRRGRKKWLLKKSLEGIVPNDILYGKKTGFGVPYGFWLRGTLKPLFFDHLQTFQQKHPGVLDEKVLRSFYDDLVSMKRDRSFLLWKVLNFMIWANRFPVRFNLS